MAAKYNGSLRSSRGYQTKFSTLFSPFSKLSNIFKIIKTVIAHYIFQSCLIGVGTAKLWRHQSNKNVIQRVWIDITITWCNANALEIMQQSICTDSEINEHDLSNLTHKFKLVRPTLSLTGLSSMTLAIPLKHKIIHWKIKINISKVVNKHHKLK